MFTRSFNLWGFRKDLLNWGCFLGCRMCRSKLSRCLCQSNKSFRLDSGAIRAMKQKLSYCNVQLCIKIKEKKCWIPMETQIWNNFNFLITIVINSCVSKIFNKIPMTVDSNILDKSIYCHAWFITIRQTRTLCCSMFCIASNIIKIHTNMRQSNLDWCSQMISVQFSPFSS